MKVKALVNFSGAVSMSKGQQQDIENDILLDDLIQAGYVEPVAISQTKTTRKNVKNESKRA